MSRGYNESIEKQYPNWIVNAYSYCMALLLLPLAICSIITIGAIGIWIAIASWIKLQIEKD